MRLTTRNGETHAARSRATAALIKRLALGQQQLAMGKVIALDEAVAMVKARRRIALPADQQHHLVAHKKET